MINKELTIHSSRNHQKGGIIPDEMLSADFAVLHLHNQ
jgi:hypothetical protein